MTPVCIHICIAYEEKITFMQYYKLYTYTYTIRVYNVNECEQT